MAQPQGFPLPHLRAWRLHKLLTSTELAQQVGISLHTLSRLESAKTRQNASLRTIAKLADALGITREQLLHDDPNTPKADAEVAA